MLVAFVGLYHNNTFQLGLIPSLHYSNGLFVRYIGSALLRRVAYKPLGKATRVALL